MIRKILKSKRAEGYLDVVIGVVALVMFIVIALNIFTFVTLKTTIDRIADDLIEVATFSGSFGDDFNAKVDQLKNKYFDFEVETYVEKYYNEEHKRVQIGDDMGFTIRVNASVAGISIALPVDVTASRIGQSEQYWKPATGIYETPPVEDDSWKPLFVLNTKSYKFHHPECSNLKSVAAANRLEMRATTTELIALGYDPCGICNPHDCKSSSVTNYNKDEHWGQCDICGKTGTAVKHTFVYDVEFLYYHCEYCNAIQTDTGTIRCHGGTPLTTETHSMSCDCDHIRPTLIVSNLSARKTNPTSLAGSVYRIKGSATDFKGSVAKVTVNGMTAVLDANGNWHYDLDCNIISNSEIIIVATDDENMKETIVCYVKTIQLEAGLYETGTTTLIKSWEDLIAEGTITVSANGSLQAIDKNAIAGDFVLPSDDSIKTIADVAFSNCKSLTSISIPEGVTRIGSHAFYQCTSLTSITIPDSVTSIGTWAFSNCTKLTSVTIPDGVTSIGERTFYQCTNLTNISIPDSVTSFGNLALSYCKSLTSVTIPSGVTSIGNSAFYQCTKLTSVTIPDSVISIGDSAFRYCNSLESITIGTNNANYCSVDGVLFTKDMTTLIQYPAAKSDTTYTVPNGVTRIVEYAFNHCANLTNVAIPVGVTNIGERTFLDCSKLTSITIPGSVTSIGTYAFQSCYSLTNVDIQNGVTSIGASAFCDCNLTSVTIPDSVTSIGSSVFGSCTKLKSITVGANNVNYCSVDGVLYSKDMKTIIQYPAAKSGTAYIIPDDVTSVGYRAFANCRSLTSVTIPDGVTSIGGYAFDGCSSLTSITIPSGVTSIGSYAFRNCGKLISATFENPNGWWYSSSSSATSGTDLSADDLANTSTAATYLYSKYSGKYWFRS